MTGVWYTRQGAAPGKVAAAGEPQTGGRRLRERVRVGILAGLVAVVVIGDFVGVVAEREEQATAAAERLRVTWKPGPRIADLQDVATALRAQASSTRTLLDTGDVDSAVAALKGDRRMAGVIARAGRDRERPMPRDVVAMLDGHRLVMRRRDSARIVERARSRRGGARTTAAPACVRARRRSCPPWRARSPSSADTGGGRAGRRGRRWPFPRAA